MDAMQADALAHTRRRQARIRLVAVSALVGLVLIASGSFSGGRLTAADAAADLAQTALKVEPPRAGEFAYTRAEFNVIQRPVDKVSKGPHRKSLVRITQRRENWLSAAENGRVSFSEIKRSPRAISRRFSKSELQPAGRYRVGDTQLLRGALARNPAVAIEAIERATRRSDQRSRLQTRWRMTIEPLQQYAPVLPANVRAALISSLAKIEGVSVRRSEPGRLNFSVAIDGLEHSASFSIDAATLMESATTVLRRGAGPFAGVTPGTEVERYVMIKNGTVGRIGRRP